MSKVKWAVASRKRRKRLIKQAKGYYGARRKHIKRVKETVMRAMAYSTRDRHVKKREFRSLWIIRLNAAARARGLTYSSLMAALRRCGIGLDRKQLSELVLTDQAAFEQLLQSALSEKPAKAGKTAVAA